MKRKMLLLLAVLLLCLCGCSLGKEEPYPIYFAPIIEEIQKSDDPYKTAFMLENWRIDGQKGGEYTEDKLYTSYIEGVSHTFDLTEYLTDSAKWHWLTEGAFQTEEENHTYICLIDFNIMYEGDIPSPQLLLLDYPTDTPEDYTVTPYTVEPSTLLSWVDQCYRIGNKLYIASKGELGVIDLTTRKLYHCQAEHQVMNEYISQNYDTSLYQMCFLNAVYEKDDVIVYSAAVAEATDMPAVAMVYAAFRGQEPVAFMSVDLEAEDIPGSIQIEMAE